MFSFFSVADLKISLLNFYYKEGIEYKKIAGHKVRPKKTRINNYFLFAL